MIKIKRSNGNIRIRVSNWLLLGISWRMPLRLIILAKIVNEYMYIPKSLLNISLNIGDIVDFDAKGIRLFLTLFGKGFEYSRYRHYPYLNSIEEDKYWIKRFMWLK